MDDNSSLFQSSANELEEGRTGSFKDLEGVEVPLSEQIPAKLLKFCQKQKVGTKIVELWQQANADRAEWLARQKELLREIDEFIDPLYNPPLNWSSTLHFPTILTVCKTYHARMYAATLGQDPPFTTTARKEANTDRVSLVQDLMRYAVKDWANHYTGIEVPIDDGIWSWVTSGTVIWKTAWERDLSRYLDVVRKPKMGFRVAVDPTTGQEQEVQTQVGTEEVEIERAKVIFEGPEVYRVFPEDFVIIDGEGDVDRAAATIEAQYLTKSELLSLVDQSVFDEKAVKKALASGRDYVGAAQNETVKLDRSDRAGMGQPDPHFNPDKYRILEAYLKMPVDGSGIDSDIIVWVHEETDEVLRATYLHRVTDTGQRPYAKADFYRRDGQEFGIGIPELIYALSKEIDAVHNMRIDFGLLSTMPFGYYRASSSMKQETIPIQPGQLVPLDDPGNDVFFPQLGNRTAFGYQEEASLQHAVDRVTGITDLNLGLVGGQGAARTATGVRGLLGESNANLDIYLRRLNRGLRKLYRYMFALLQRKLPDGLEFRLTGEDGQKYFRRIPDRREIAGSYDFELEPNSSNSNKQVQQDVAQQIYQMTGNPLDIQLGIISPLERFNAIKNLMQSMGVKDFSRFLRMPKQFMRLFTPEEIANRVLAGMDVQLGPDQDLQGFDDYVNALMQDDHLLGQFTEEQAVALRRKQLEAEALLQALQAQQAQQANAQQMQANANQATQQTNPGGGAMGSIGPAAAPPPGAASNGNNNPAAA
jgi:hypothetical protein